MQDHSLYAITALFKTPEALVRATEAVANAGLRRFDAYAPYPVAGMNSKLALKPSRLPRLSLVFGLLGFSIALLFQWYTSTIDYPLALAGKSLFVLPAWIPISCEVSLLFAAAATFVAFITFLCRLPKNSHPLHDTVFMTRVSSDHFGIAIEACDSRFDDMQVRTLLQTIGGEDISSVYQYAPKVRPKQILFSLKFVALALLTAVGVAGITFFANHELPLLPPFNWMTVQLRSLPQTPSFFFSDGTSMRSPAEGTVARGFLPYAFAGQPDLAESTLTNPMLPTRSVLQNGKHDYLVFCSPCHGNFAKGDSRLQGQFPVPPSLHTERAQNYKDGRLYHIITEGQNTMPGLFRQIAPEARWKIVHYLRALQRSQNPKESDAK